MLLKTIRNHKGISLRALAVKAGMSYTFISNVENGKADPSLSTLQRLAKALNVSMIDLLKDGPDHGKASVKKRKKKG